MDPTTTKQYVIQQINQRRKERSQVDLGSNHVVYDLLNTTHFELLANLIKNPQALNFEMYRDILEKCEDSDTKDTPYYIRRIRIPVVQLQKILRYSFTIVDKS